MDDFIISSSTGGFEFIVSFDIKCSLCASVLVDFLCFGLAFLSFVFFPEQSADSQQSASSYHRVGGMDPDATGDGGGGKGSGGRKELNYYRTCAEKASVGPV